MTGCRPWLWVLLIAAAFAAGVIHLFGLEFSHGTVYPEYSSLRTDPKGARLLYDSLSAIPGLTVERSYVPMALLPQDGVALLLLGIDPDHIGGDREKWIQPVEDLARRGNRTVAAFDLTEGAKEVDAKALDTVWHVALALGDAKKHEPRLYFSTAQSWNVIDRTSGRLTAIEKTFGKGSVVLVADSAAFDNGATASRERLGLVTAAIGPYRHVVFDEQHFGIQESGSVVALARRLHLTGLAVGLAILTALFLWKSASAFPPPGEEPAAGNSAGRTAHAGLVTLLRRHIPAAELAATCWRQWSGANRQRISEQRRQRAEAIVRDWGARPLEAMRALYSEIHRKGEL
jgi:hypothetical protein